MAHINSFSLLYMGFIWYIRLALSWQQREHLNFGNDYPIHIFFLEL